VAVVARPFALTLRLPLLLVDLIADLLGRAGEALRNLLPARRPHDDPWREFRAQERRGWLAATARGLGLAALLAFALAPFYWIVITAFKSNRQISSWYSPLWPEPWTVAQFATVLGASPFTTWYRNTLQVALVSCAVSTVVGALGAYAIARLRFRGGAALASTILGTALVPSVLFLVPLFLLLSQLRLINTPWALLVAYPSFGLPMACWLLLGYFRALPEELEEAALIDGCTHWQAFLRIVLPLSRPALLAVALFTLTQAWNEFVFASFFVRSEAGWTLPRGLAAMVTGDIFPYGRMFAASLMMALPIIVAAAIGQRAMVTGLTAGAVKG
jgi:multiple sugar transport system permease protein